MSDCNGSPCRDWIITLAQDGTMTVWGWAAVVVLAVGLTAVLFGMFWLIDRSER